MRINAVERNYPSEFTRTNKSPNFGATFTLHIDKKAGEVVPFAVGISQLAKKAGLGDSAISGNPFEKTVKMTFPNNLKIKEIVDLFERVATANKVKIDAVAEDFVDFKL